MENRDGKLLSLLFKHGPLSNQELANAMHISPSTVSSAAVRLLKLGAINKIDARHFNSRIQIGQRKKRSYCLNPEYGFAIVVEIDYDGLIIHITNFDLSISSTRRVPITQNKRDRILSIIEKELHLLLSEHKANRLLGIGFSMPGQVDAQSRKALHNTRINGWENVNFDQFKSFSENIITENVANALTIGENLRGSAQGVDDFILLHVGNGAGMGIMIAGKLHHGHNYAAGEAGHVIVDENSGTSCNCGNRGCLESFVSRRAVMKELERLRKNEVPSGILTNPALSDGSEVYRLLGEYYESGDKVAYLVVAELAHKLGLAAANFAQVLDPARIVLSGPICNLGTQFLNLVQQTIKRYHLPWLDQVPVVFGQNENTATAQGVAFLIFQKIWKG